MPDAGCAARPRRNSCAASSRSPATQPCALRLGGSFEPVLDGCRIGIEKSALAVVHKCAFYLAATHAAFPYQAAVLLADILILYLPGLRYLYSLDGFGDPAIFDDQFASPSARWSLLRLLPATWGPQTLLGLWILAALALLVGYRPRIAAFVCWVIAVSFLQANLYLHNGGDQLKLFLRFCDVFTVWIVTNDPLKITRRLICLFLDKIRYGEFI